MDIVDERIGGALVVGLRGRLDGASSPAAGARLAELIAPPIAIVVLDLAQLEYLTSAGFRTLLLARRHAEALGARLVLCGLSETLGRLFELGGFLSVFPIRADRAAALALDDGRG